MNVRLVEAKNKKQVVKKKYLTASFFSCKIGKVIVMEEILKQTLLYDFYGELLTEHQKQVYEDVILNDYSLSDTSYPLAKEHYLLKLQQFVNSMLWFRSVEKNEFMGLATARQ